MFPVKNRKFAAAFGLAAASVTTAGLAIAAPAAQAATAQAGLSSASTCNPEFDPGCNFFSGEHLAVVYGNSPLRRCASTNCAVIVYMPVTKSFNPGGGWVTSEANQSPGGAWCKINYRGNTGWTGCWRLSA